MDGDNLPATLDEVGAEMAATEAIMGTRAYWTDEPRHDRYLRLIERREELESEAPEAEAPDDPLAIASQAEFFALHPGAGHADYGAYVSDMREAGDVYFGLPEGEQTGFVAAFEALPDGLIGAMLAELRDRSYADPDPDAAEPFEEFRGGQGHIIVSEWGAEAPERYAKAWGRLFRIADNIETDADAETFGKWLAGLSPNAAAAVYRKLAA